MNIGSTNFEKWFVLRRLTQEEKNYRIDSQHSLTKWRCFFTVLLTRCKHFNYWLSSFNSLLNYWACFPKDSWVILKQDKVLDFLLRFEFQLLKTSWLSSLNVSRFAAKLILFALFRSIYCKAFGYANSRFFKQVLCQG